MIIAISKLRMKMELPIDGNLTMKENEENGLLFELYNNDAFINAYIEAKPEAFLLNDIISNQIKLLKQADFTLSDNLFLKKYLNKMENTRTSQVKSVKTKFKDARFLIFKKDETEQLQLFVDLGRYFLLFGLVLKDGLNSKTTTKVDKYLSDIIKGVNSLA